MLDAAAECRRGAALLAAGCVAAVTDGYPGQPRSGLERAAEIRGPGEHDGTDIVDIAEPRRRRRRCEWGAELVKRY
ncbi:MAG: hypothetical protein ACRDTH_14045 [Pseudonocardiaceae bacterium]